jgi:hypothetical protein
MHLFTFTYIFILEVHLLNHYAIFTLEKQLNNNLSTSTLFSINYKLPDQLIEEILFLLSINNDQTIPSPPLVEIEVLLPIEITSELKLYYKIASTLLTNGTITMKLEKDQLYEIESQMEMRKYIYKNSVTTTIDESKKKIIYTL